MQKGEGLQILSPNKMLKRLPIKAGNKTDCLFFISIKRN